MIEIIFIWLVTAGGLWITTKIVKGVDAESPGALLVAALVLGLINSFIKPVLLFLTLPITILTFGIFALVINALMISLTSVIVPGFKVDGFGSALLAAIVMALFYLCGILLFGAFLGTGVHWIFWYGHPHSCGIAV